MHWVLRTICYLSILLFLGLSAVPSVWAQADMGFERGRGRDMLKVIKDDIKKNYYDPNYHGIDLESRFKTADEKMQQAQSVGQVFGIIAQALLDFDDSHTFFLPPGRSNSLEYGWQMQAIGDHCYVVAVKPGSDAEAKGLKPGDEVLSIGGFKPSRELIWKLNYLFNALRPVPVMPLTLLTPGGQQRQLEVQAKIKQGKRVLDLTGSDGGMDLNQVLRESEDEDRFNRHRYTSLGDKLMVWKMPQFDLEEGGVSEMMGKVKKHEMLILDLRGNGGGYVKTLEWLLGYFFEKDVKIADLKGRKEMKPHEAKGKGSNAYKGKLVVLIDSKSGSAAELFARVIQLEKRGTVIGDRSAGAVMRSQHFSHQVGTDRVVFYGASVTDADLIMTDGKSLENVGVTPDELLLPTPADLAAKRDPVLSRAAALLGIELPPEKAGAMFPLEWRKQ
jgi:C-terminal processing protease CtpA/Prc